MSVITRFPPSPTGFMHIGNARTALFNWLYAKAKNGKFVVRIEDTDRKRHSEEAVEAIINGLKWLELDWDGDVTSQFANQERHKEVAEELLAKGQAYKCYCSPDELEAMREKAKAEGQPTFYNRRWRDKSDDEAPKDIKPTIRIKAPLEGDITINDRVQGDITVKAQQLDDFIILRSDGTPTYMLSVVVDDHDMGITHVIRGDDHINNTFRQYLIFKAMGWDIPTFAHLPLIHGPDGGKFSKRHGATSVEEYRDMGYLPEAMRNYLLRLGWSHGDEEIIPTEKAIEWFDLDKIGKSAARFDFAKLEYINAHYIKEGDNERLLELTIPFYHSKYDATPDENAMTMILACMDELKSRAKTLIQIADESVFFIHKDIESYTEKAKKALQDSGQDILQALIDMLETLEGFQKDNIQQSCKDIADNHANGKLGKIGMPLRAALTGTTVSPSIFHVAEVLGKEQTIQRLHNALSSLKK